MGMDKELNRNIKNFRDFRGMTQEDLASHVGKTKNVISNWERGDNNPDVDSVERICLALDVTPNEIFGWDKCKEYEEYVYKKEQKKIRIMELEEQKKKIQYEIDNLMNNLDDKKEDT